MRVLALGFAAYVVALVSASALVVYLLRPATSEWWPVAGHDRAAPDQTTNWYDTLSRRFAALRDRDVSAAGAKPVLVTEIAAPRAPTAALPAVAAAPDPVVAPAPVAQVDVAPAPPSAVPEPVVAASDDGKPQRAIDPHESSALAKQAPTTSPPAPEIALFLQRGDALLASGDLTGARLFYQRAAEHGDPTAARGLAKSYDPLFLEQAGFRSVRGDPSVATAWYRTAAAAGDTEAAQRLTRLLAGAATRAPRD